MARQNHLYQKNTFYGVFFIDVSIMAKKLFLNAYKCGRLTKKSEPLKKTLFCGVIPIFNVRQNCREGGHILQFSGFLF